MADDPKDKLRKAKGLLRKYHAMEEPSERGLAEDEKLGETSLHQHLVLARLPTGVEKLYLARRIIYSVAARWETLKEDKKDRILADARKGKVTTLRELQAGLRLVEIPKKELPDDVKASIEGKYIKVRVRLPWKPSKKEELRRDFKRVAQGFPGIADAAARAWRRRGVR